MNFILWLSLHQYLFVGLFIVLLIALIIFYKWIHKTKLIYFSLLSVLTMSGLVSFFIAAYPININHFTHFETKGTYVLNASASDTMIENNTLIVWNKNGKQTVLPHANQYQVRKTSNIEQNQVVIQHRVLNKTASSLEVQYYNKIVRDGHVNHNTALNQILFSDK